MLPSCYQIRRGWVRQNTTVFVSYLLGWRHVLATVGHPQVTKIYNEEKIYSTRTLVVVQILSSHATNTLGIPQAFHWALISPLGFFTTIEIYNTPCTLNSRHFTHKTSLTTYIYIYILYSPSSLPVEYITSFNIDNRKTTRSRWKLGICTTNVLILYIFSSFYIFVTKDGPKWPKHVVNLINGIQRQLCFDVPTPF